MNGINKLLRARYSVGRHHSMRVNEGRNSWNIPAIKSRSRTIVGWRGEKSLISDPGSELRLRREEEKGGLRR